MVIVFMFLVSVIVLYVYIHQWFHIYEGTAGPERFTTLTLSEGPTKQTRLRITVATTNNLKPKTNTFATLTYATGTHRTAVPVTPRAPRGSACEFWDLGRLHAPTRTPQVHQPKIPTPSRAVRPRDAPVAQVIPIFSATTVPTPTARYR